MLKKIFLRYRFTFLWTVGVIFFLVLMTNPADNRANKNGYLINQTENEIFHGTDRPQVDPGFWKIKDSLDRIRDWHISRLAGFGSSMFTAYIGVSKIYECDSCNSPGELTAYQNKYFIQLSGYTMKWEAYFFIKNGKYYLRTRTADGHRENSIPYGDYEIREIPVRYTTGVPGNLQGGALLIPISEKSYNILKTVIWGLYIFFILFSVFVLFSLPARILYSIAKGSPFTRKNIQRLRITGWVLLSIALLPPILAVVAEQLFSSKIPGEIYYPFYQSILDNRSFLVAGVIVLLVATAFNRGYKIQEEQELTV